MDTISEPGDDNRPFELRFYLTWQFADAVKKGVDAPGLAPLQAALGRHGAKIDHSQLDEFQNFLIKHQAVENWEEAYPDPKERKFNFELEAFTLKTVLDDVKREYLSREFTVSTDSGRSFQGTGADALMADLNALENSGILGTGPRVQRAVCRKVFFPARHPGTTG